MTLEKNTSGVCEDCKKERECFIAVTLKNNKRRFFCINCAEKRDMNFNNATLFGNQEYDIQEQIKAINEGIERLRQKVNVHITDNQKHTPMLKIIDEE